MSRRPPQDPRSRALPTTDFAALETVATTESEEELPERGGSSAKASRQWSRQWLREQARQERNERLPDLDQVADLGDDFEGDPRLNHLVARVAILEQESLWWRDWWTRHQRLWRVLESLTRYFRKIRQSLRDARDPVLPSYHTGSPNDSGTEIDEEDVE